MSRFFRILPCILACVAIFAAPAVSRADTVDRIVAVVNGEIITLFELNERIKPVLERFRGRELGPEEKAAILKLKEQALQKMVDDILLQKEAARFQLDASETAVDNEVRGFRLKNGLTEEQFNEQLKLEGTTSEEFRDRVRRDILKHKLLSFMVRRKVVVTQEEIQARYEAHSQDYVKDKRVGVGIIVLPAGMPALEIKRRIESGETDFATAASTYSQGPGKEQGGDIGELEWKSLAPQWKQALDGLGQGQVSEPIDIQGREALLTVLYQSGGEVQPLEAVTEEIRGVIMRQKLEERFNEYMEQLRTEAVIDIRL